MPRYLTSPHLNIYATFIPILILNKRGIHNYRSKQDCFTFQFHRLLTCDDWGTRNKMESFLLLLFKNVKSLEHYSKAETNPVQFTNFNTNEKQEPLPETTRNEMISFVPHFFAQINSVQSKTDIDSRAFTHFFRIFFWFIHRLQL